MISQAIKGWLQRLFAWWPWKSTPAANYAYPVSSINKNIAPEATMYTTTVDGTISQPGSSSVAVEHTDEEFFTELAWTSHDERPEPTMPPLTPVVEAQGDIPIKEQNKPTARNVSFPSTPTPTAVQKLEFLRYLVQRGLVNEGFDRGYEPEQYRKKR